MTAILCSLAINPSNALLDWGKYKAFFCILEILCMLKDYLSPAKQYKMKARSTTVCLGIDETMLKKKRLKWPVNA